MIPLISRRMWFFAVWVGAGVASGAFCTSAGAGEFHRDGLVWKLDLENREVRDVSVAISFIPDPEVQAAVRAGWTVVELVNAAGGNQGVEISGVFGMPNIFVAPKGRGPYKVLVKLQKHWGSAFKENVAKVDKWLVKVDPGRAIGNNGMIDKWFGKRKDDEPVNQAETFDAVLFWAPPKDARLKYKAPVVLECVKGGRVLDADSNVKEGRLHANGTRIQVWDRWPNTQTNQRWWVVESDDGCVTFFNVQSGLVLDAHHPDREKNGCKIQLQEHKAVGVQKWRLEPAADGAFLVRCSDGGRLLDADDGGTDKNGGKVQLWELFPGNKNQHWRIKEQ